jgi:hypothetical protein
MGQYYVAIIMDAGGKFIRAWFNPHNYEYGAKLTEHSGVKSAFVAAVAQQICPEGMLYRSAVVWAGDYADKEEGLDVTLYDSIDLVPNQKKGLGSGHYLRAVDMSVYPYLVNWTKRLYVDARKETHEHPLPLLTVEGNGRGGGDYRGTSMELVGTWARDELSFESTAPEFAELVCGFKMNYE